MTSLGFENYAEALKIYLTKYREVRETQRPFTLATSLQNILLTSRVQSQSQRTDNGQGRPSSQGYGAPGGAAGGANAAAPGFPTGELGGQPGDAGADASYLYGAQNNGAAGDGY